MIAKLRFWDRVNKEFVFPTQILWGEDGIAHISNGAGNTYWYLEAGEFEVDLAIGVKTKDGTEVYENDVVYIAGTGHGLVKWDDNDLQWVFDVCIGGENYGYQDIIEDLESVAGNIHEHPDLRRIP